MRTRLFLLVLVTALLAACASHTKELTLQQTLDAYANTIRWGEIGQAIQFIDPEVLKEEPLDQLQLARYKQVRVSQYDSDGPVPVSDTEVHQRVAIGLINIHSQRQRSIVDNQVWRYDPEKERWWLESGLPDITP